MISWRVVCVLGIVVVLVCCSTTGPREEYFHDPGMNNRLSWEAEHGTIAEGTVILQSPTGTDVAQIRQKVHDLKPHTNYTLSVRARALSTPSAQLSSDLFLEDGYDSPDQELLVLPDEIDATYRTFQRHLNTRDLPDQPYLRIFTFSTVPIEIDEVGLVESR